MSSNKAYSGSDIFDGCMIHEGAALLVSGGVVTDIVGTESIPSDYEEIILGKGTIMPGLIDLQVNGGGGVLFNDDPSVNAIGTICKAHESLGTTDLLPTLITDTPDVTKRAIDSGIEAADQQIDGFLGLHLEGPHLAVSRKGAHREDLVRPMDDADVVQLCEARKHLPNLMVTLAPDVVTDDHITELSNAGVVVSLGHSDASAGRAKEAFAAGARCATHLFNAMSGLTHREPGVVGAVLVTHNIYAGLIADGLHVLPDVINIALRAKQETTNLFLVSDAMSPAGTDMTEFQLNGRQVTRQAKRLTLNDGTLAGADLDLVSAIRFITENTHLTSEEAMKMVTTTPGKCLQMKEPAGALKSGAPATFIRLSKQMQLAGIWRSGVKNENGDARTA